MAGNFEYRGDLSKTALPEILYSVYRFQVPGVVEARQGEVVKRVYIKEGSILHATSSDPGDRLGAYLLRTGRLTRQQYEVTMRERQGSEERYGVLLLQHGLMSPREVYEAIREQVEAIVWSLFYWREGEVTFQIGDLDLTPMVRIHLPVRQVILAGIKRAPDAKRLVARLGTKETVFAPRFDPEDLIDIALDRDEYAVLQSVDGRRSLYEICTMGPLPAADTARLMYAFQVLRLVRCAQVAAGAAAEPEQPPAPVPEKPAVRRIRFRTEAAPGSEEI